MRNSDNITACKIPKQLRIVIIEKLDAQPIHGETN